MKNTHAQEEMMGFVLIVILVAIIGLIFLSIALRTEKESPNDRNIQNLLQSLEQVTTECKTNVEYLDITDLTKKCVEQGTCNGENACEVLERELKNILNKSLPCGEEFPVKSYEMAIFYNDTTTFSEIMNIKKGEWEGKKVGAEYKSPINSGEITTILKIGYAN